MAEQVSIADLIEEALLTRGIVLRYNEFSHSVMISSPKYAEREMNDLDQGALDIVLYDAGLKPSARIIEASISQIAFKNKFHPVRDYLDGLKWDGVPRIDSWLIKYMAADDTPFVRAVSRIVLVGAVRRVRRPGCKFDECLVLVGKEGIGKSTAVKILAGEWFSDNLPLGADPKETVEQTASVWLCESAELVGNSPSMIGKIKAFLSRSTDGPFRKAWGKTPGKVARQFVPIGTTNDAAFLHSTTGDRRFWPVKVYGGSKQIEVDRDQLWAEAAAMEATGETIHLDPSLWEAAKEAQEKFRAPDPWEVKLSSLTAQSVSLHTALELIGIPVDRASGKDSQRILNIMMKLGYMSDGRTQQNGIRTTFFTKLTPFHPETFDRNPETAPVEPEEPEDYDYRTPEEIARDNKMLEDEFGDADPEDYL